MKGDDAGRTGGGKRSRKSPAKGILTAALVIASAGVFLAGLFDLQNFDIWWHLKTGELIVTEGSIPDTDPFSYTAYGQSWITHEWLSEVVFYLVQMNLGYSGLIYLKALILSLAITLLLSLSLRKGGTTLPFILFPLFLFPLSLRAIVRPHIFTLLFTCVLLFLLYRYRDERSRRSLFLIPPMFLVWANMHSGVTLGLVILASFTVGHEAARRLFKKEGKAEDLTRTRHLAITLAVSLVASLVNPHHVEALIYPFLLAKNPVFTKTIAELKSPLSPEYNLAFWQLGFLSLIPITAVTAYITRRYKDFAFLFPLLIFLTLSFFAHRNVPTFTAIALIYTSVSLTGHSRGREPRKGKGSPRQLISPKAVHIFGLIIPSLTIILLIIKGAYIGDDGWLPLSTKIKYENYPVGACEFLEEAGIDGNMFNRMMFGGYVIYNGYPERKVFIDGRLLLYGDDFSRAYLDAYYGSIGIEALVRRYDTDYFLLDYPEESDPRMLQYYLSNSTDWKLVYWDDNSLVYVRNDSTHSAAIEEFGYDSVDPIYRLGFQVEKQIAKSPESFIMEVERQLALRPETSIARVFLGTAYEKTGRTKEAIRELEKVLQKDPSRKDLQNKLYMLRLSEETSATALEGLTSETEDAPSTLAEGLAYLSRGQYEKARDALLTATIETPDDANAFYNLALAYRSLGDRNQARRYLEKAIKVNPNYVAAHNDLGIIYGMEGMLDTSIRHFETALRVNPNNVSVLYNFAIALDKAGEPEKAREKLERILEIDPDHQKAAGWLGRE
jgi:tetratricopeptide (TPR) repeat protein